VNIYDLLAPSDLIATLEDNNVSLSWNGSEVLTDEFIEFILYRNEEIISTQTETIYLDENMSIGNYTYSVVAVYNNGISEPVTCNVSIYFLSPPVGLSAVGGDKNINLSWEKPEEVEYLRGFKIYRNDVFLTSILLSDEEPHYFDNDVTNGTKYKYFVTALYENGESEPSNIISVWTIFPAPENLVAEKGDSQVILDWDTPETCPATLTSYKIYRNNMLLSNTTICPYLDTNMVINGRDYTYYITAVYTVESIEYESGTSDTIFVTPGTANEDGILDVVITELRSNYPNPFNPTTIISYSVLNADNIIIEIYNIKGQRVKTLVNENKNTGHYQVTWNGTDDSGRSVSSGIYFYKMTTGDFVDIKKMMILK
jgi:hypothetical protein